MESSIENAFILLIVGMLTVFVVLSLVVLTGILIIRVINRFSHEVPSEKKQKSSLAPNTLAAITAVVEQLTNGKGKIEKIQKI